jgi:hypothetical protein
MPGDPDVAFPPPAVWLGLTAGEETTGTAGVVESIGVLVAVPPDGACAVGAVVGMGVRVGVSGSGDVTSRTAVATLPSQPSPAIWIVAVAVCTPGVVP